MRTDPVLAKKMLMGWPENGRKEQMIPFYVNGGLHYIRGNSAPYFSLTYSHGGSGGAGHDEILKHFPQFADLAALHLSDIDGVPMHAEANGWYHLAGSFVDQSAFGDRYHAGNSDRHFPDGYRKPTGDECLGIFAEHCRISQEEARKIHFKVLRAALNERCDRLNVAKMKTAEFMQPMRPRWKAEADACIAKHGLVIYGDQWQRPSAA